MAVFFLNGKSFAAEHRDVPCFAVMCEDQSHLLPQANSVTFTIPMVPPSCNSLYQVHYKEPDPSRRVTLRPEARRWKQEGLAYIPRFRIADDSVLRVDRCYYYPWLTKKGSWAKRDSSNLDKLLMDLIAERIGRDDRVFKCGYMDSVNSPVERTVITLVEVPLVEWSARS